MSNPTKKNYLYMFLWCTHFLWNKNSDSILLLPTQFSKIRIKTGTFSCAEFHDLKPRLSFKWCSLNVYSPSPDSCVHQRNLYSVLVLLRDKIQGDFFLQVEFFTGPPLDFLSTKFLYNRQHLEKFSAKLNGILKIENLGGTSKKSHPVTELTLNFICTNLFIRSGT